MTAHGPKVRELIATLMTADLRPQNLYDIINYILSPRLKERAEDAERRVMSILTLIEATHDNPHGDDDEAIAGDILTRIEEVVAALRVSASTN